MAGKAIRRGPVSEALAAGAAAFRPAARSGAWRGYGVAVLCVGLAVLARLLLDPVIEPDPPFVLMAPPFLLLIAAVLLSAWYGGLGPGLLATALGAALACALFIPRYPPVAGVGWGTPVLVFALEGGFISWFAQRLRRALRRSEESVEMFRLLADGTRDYAIFMLDASGRVSGWNAGAERLSGYAAGEILGEHFRCLYAEEDARQGEPERHLRAAAAGGQVEDEGWRVRKGGSRFWAGVALTALRDGAGRLRGFAVLTRDGTERRRAVEALRLEHEFNQRLIDTAQAVILVLDPAGRIVRANRYLERLTGHLIDEVRGKDWFDTFLPEQDRGAIRELFARAIGGTRIRGHANPIVTRDGRLRDIEWCDAELTDATGRLAGLLCVGMDVTERRRAERALRESEERLRLMADALPVLISYVDTGGRFRFNNAAYEHWFGVPRERWYGRHVRELLGDAAYETVREHMEAALAGQARSFETRVTYRGGASRYVQVDYVPHRDPDGKVAGCFALVRDLTERKRMEEGLRAQQARLRAILDTAADGIVTIDDRGVIESVNPAAERMFGYRAEEMVGQNVKLLMPPPFRDEHDGYLAEYLRTGVRRMIGVGREVTGRRKDGSTFPIDLAVSETDHPRSFTGVLRDITRRKELEREVLEIAALEQRRIGQDLHDGVGQELTGLGLMADALAQRLAGVAPAEGELAAKVAGGLERVHRTVQALSRGLVPVEVDPEGLRAALEDLAARTREQAGVACALECAGPVELADGVTATHLFRIAQEAVSNALRHARPRQIRIGLAGGPAALTLAVRDDGVGIPEPAGEEKGLGIRLMRHRAGVIGGTLAVGAAEGGGTLVTCTLPRGNGNA